jgi:hypothetical protein
MKEEAHEDSEVRIPCVSIQLRCVSSGKNSLTDTLLSAGALSWWKTEQCEKSFRVFLRTVFLKRRRRILQRRLIDTECQTQIWFKVAAFTWNIFSMWYIASNSIFASCCGFHTIMLLMFYRPHTTTTKQTYSLILLVQYMYISCLLHIWIHSLIIKPSHL